MEKENEKKIPADAGIDKQWLVAVAEKGLEPAKEWSPKEIKDIGAARAESRIQRILQQFYWDLMDGLKESLFIGGDMISSPDEDMFDKWYENMELEEYSQKYQLLQKFNVVAGAIGVTKTSGVGTEAEFQGILSRIAMRCVEEPEGGHLENIAKVINEMYPNLANPLRNVPSAVEMNEREKLDYDLKRMKLIEGIDSNIEDFEEELAQIQAAMETEFEEIAQRLNQVVIFGTSNWELTLYSAMSAHAPRVIINGLSYRSNLHYLLPGDISTAKSKILEIVHMVSPKSLVVDKTTVASFEGVVKMGEDEIQEGVLDMANGGDIIVEEMTREFTKMPLFRRAMDCKLIRIFKGGRDKTVLVNTTMMAACNPNDDFFIEEQENAFRKQLKFKEGILSRFDITIPLTATQVKNDMFIEKLNLFGDTEVHVDYDDIKDRLTTIATGMLGIRQVAITAKQQRTLKDAFKMHNETDRHSRILKNRPLVILRDLETLARLVNTIVSVNFSKRETDELEDGTRILHAEDDDINKAIQLWENLLQLRIQLYARSRRNLVTVADEIVLYIHQKGRAGDVEVSLPAVRDHFVQEQRLCSRSTFYNEVKGLRESGRIVQYGQNNATVKVVIR